CPYVRLSFCLSVCLSVCLSLSVCLFAQYGNMITHPEGLTTQNHTTQFSFLDSYLTCNQYWYHCTPRLPLTQTSTAPKHTSSTVTHTSLLGS
uniref:Uncharacterized protein n=1 Tax=Hucho hucho TaxID=62062 RepID=A0A4W5JKT1_9TELE